MYKLLIISLSGLPLGLSAQSIHGEDFKMDCSACHNSDSWEIPASTWDFQESLNAEAISSQFNHYNTLFPLEGQHAIVDCRSCHETLIFPIAEIDCISCHTDLHNLTVGADCARCHSTENWLVDNITELHQENGFPLLGVHATVSCTDCHISESSLQFYRIGNDCINCHLVDYNATINPNHTAVGYSFECTECHSIDGFDWSAENILHDFFPLTKGHEIADCSTCHTSGSYYGLSPDCVICHQSDYDEATDPNHRDMGFPTDCKICHSTDIGWMPTNYSGHDDEYFPIYSGKHKGEWDECIDCHTIEGNYTTFSCIDCHEHNNESSLGNKHDEVSDYEYTSAACYSCHPTGNE